MPVLTTSYNTTQSTLVREIVQAEDDGAIGRANATGIIGSGMVQANGFIGDGPNGTTAGDADAFSVDVAAGSVLRVDIDAASFGSHDGKLFDPLIQVFNSATGALVSFNDNSDGPDSYLSFTNASGAAQNYTIILTDASHPLSDPFNPSSGGSAGSVNPETDTGYYRAFINVFNPAQATQGQIIVGTNNPETLNGTAGNDVIELMSGNDTTTPGKGDDVVRWDMADGSDTIIGSRAGDGTDELDVSSDQFGQGFTFAPNANGFGYVLAASDRGFGKFRSESLTVTEGVELLTIHGGDGSDAFTYSAANYPGAPVIHSDVSNITFFGGGGENFIQASNSSMSFKVFGGDGNDHLTTGSGNDTFYGNAGDDYMDARAGNDILNYGLVGRDLNIDLNLTTAQNTGGAGMDTILNFETVIGGSGWDRIQGDTKANYLIGFDGNDTLLGGSGAANTMQGGRGNDTYVVQAVGDSITEFAFEGNDTVQTALSSFKIPANVENLTHTGNVSFTGIGNTQGNIMTGGAGNDYLIGVDGDDIFVDGVGLNTFQGGPGNDRYAVQLATDSVYEVAGEGTDEVQTFLATYQLTHDVENLRFVGTNAHTGTGNELNNVIRGNDGADVLDGKAGNDNLTGGAGADLFKFTTAPDTLTNDDLIMDFGFGDKIVLDHSIFTNIGPIGTLASSAFAAGFAPTASTRIIYDVPVGQLYYDADGSGPTERVQIATLGRPTADWLWLQSSDILIV